MTRGLSQGNFSLVVSSYQTVSHALAHLFFVTTLWSTDVKIEARKNQATLLGLLQLRKSQI